MGLRLRELRKDAGLTGRELAAATGWHFTRVSKLEHGVQAPSNEDIRLWCEACSAEEQIADLIAQARTVESMYMEFKHLGDTGHALWDLAVRQGKAEQEGAARLASAVAGHTETYVRSRAMSGIKLASLTMTVGDPQEAVIGAQALKDARSLRSRRAADDLRDLARRATVFERIDEVDELRHDIRNVLAAS
ncbi:helix-turn-helix domain-containing protein [Kribbella flavida]|uniref:helix-turn-helix domain-containing protein n=1 Tax=Kribbella flavida TaxID=182640 RepID=UPI00019BD973|nr:helix-turn-helix transcriptional regulator [Kribbella flavida]